MATLTADGDLIRRVLENLLDNAIRHAPGGSRVVLSARASPGGVELRVADAGAGISAGLRQTIFERFAQVEGDAHARHRSGRGLGLAFCKLAVEAHRGTIAAEDANPGCIFVVRLPQ